MTKSSLLHRLSRNAAYVCTSIAGIEPGTIERKQTKDRRGCQRIICNTCYLPFNDASHEVWYRCYTRCWQHSLDKKRWMSPSVIKSVNTGVIGSEYNGPQVENTRKNYVYFDLETERYVYLHCIESSRDIWFSLPALFQRFLWVVFGLILSMNEVATISVYLSSVNTSSIIVIHFFLSCLKLIVSENLKFSSQSVLFGIFGRYILFGALQWNI